MQHAKISEVKKGEYFKRTESAKKVFKRGEYCRTSKAYECSDVNDINSVVFIKSTKPVFIGFTY